MEVWQIGNEGGFLADPVNLTADNGNRLLLGLAERADLIVDFTGVPVGNHVLGSHVLGNVGPDEPFSGGVPGVDFTVADPASAGRVLEFRVVPALAPDPTTPPRFLVLPAITRLTGGTTRPLALLERASAFFPDAPVEARLGTVDGDPNTATAVATPRRWMDPVTENPRVGDTEVWEYYNATADATRCTSTRWPSRSWTGRRSSWTRRPGPFGWTPPRRRPAGALGERVEGHRGRLPGPGDPAAAAVHQRRAVRLALPHRRARGQRDDAAVPDRAAAARPAGRCFDGPAGRRFERPPESEL